MNALSFFPSFVYGERITMMYIRTIVEGFQWHKAGLCNFYAWVWENVTAHIPHGASNLSLRLNTNLSRFDLAQYGTCFSTVIGLSRVTCINESENARPLIMKNRYFFRYRLHRSPLLAFSFLFLFFFSTRVLRYGSGLTST
ncbi:hypothetical protein Ahy_B06g081141 isoform D [Arachis hypogaea]|uniref:Uncharacterized protein n=1 Tax=Arachis hypogaea TaxID=3818 RepID=A0A444YKA7_ARAHY|nr:hypothetical protein Ahy_B06g081141 isoform D [Arachis hypogaea]